MGVGLELAGRRQSLKGCALPDRLIAINEVDDLGRKDEEAAINQAAVTLGLFYEGSHTVFGINVDGTETPRWIGSGKRGLKAVGTMKFRQACDVDVAHAIAIGEVEGLFAFKIICHALEAPPRSWCLRRYQPR